jgi:hypothetical protein
MATGSSGVASGRERLIAMMADGRVLTRRSMEAAGIPRTTTARMIDDGTLQRQGTGTYVLASEWDGDPFPAVASRFGGTADAPHGVVCLRAAAVLHRLTDIDIDQLPDGVEVGVPRHASPRKGGLHVRVVRWSHPSAFQGLVWRDFGRCGMHVTSPARTACDLFSPWRGDVPEEFAVEALARLHVADPAAAAEAVGFARRLGWEDAIAPAYEAIDVSGRFRGNAGHGR